MNSMTIKTDKEMKAMIEGGKKLAQVKKRLFEKVKVGENALAIEELATKLIEKSGGKPSFKMVPNYYWSTCININEGVVHGIPRKSVIFKKGDLVSVDLGMYYKGFHTDTSFSVLLGEDREKKRFFETGKKALEKAISKMREGNKVGDISAAIEDTLKSQGYSPVKVLTGHGIGRELHEDPRVPGYVSESADEQVKIVKGMALAIEVIYAQGSDEVILGSDGWTISTKDAKISALFEETVAISRHGRIVLSA
jgi:methionyl aminopeptidase